MGLQQVPACCCQAPAANVGRARLAAGSEGDRDYPLSVITLAERSSAVRTVLGQSFVTTAPLSGPVVTVHAHQCQARSTRASAPPNPPPRAPSRPPGQQPAAENKASPQMSVSTPGSSKQVDPLCVCVTGLLGARGAGVWAATWRQGRGRAAAHR